MSNVKNIIKNKKPSEKWVGKRLSESDKELIKSIDEIENGTAKLYSREYCLKQDGLWEWWKEKHKEK
jgi:hypothetical protein